MQLGLLRKTSFSVSCQATTAIPGDVRPRQEQYLNMLETFACLVQTTGRHFVAVLRVVRKVKELGEPILRTQTLLSFTLMYKLFTLILIKIMFFTIILVLVVIYPIYNKIELGHNISA